MMPSVSRMAADALDRLGEIDRSERITQQYRCRDGVLTLVDVDIDAPRWGQPGQHTVEHHIAEWKAYLDQGAILLGAVDGDRLVGIAILQPSIADGLANLAVLHVSRESRRTGVGAELCDAAKTAARESGAQRLYVSATPTRGTVDFYVSQGFTPLVTPDPTMFEREPDDIHLEAVLTTSGQTAPPSPASDCLLCRGVCPDCGGYVGAPAGSANWILCSLCHNTFLHEPHE